MIESLESRIAPAAVVTYLEADGDKIKVVTSKGTKAELLTALAITDDANVATERGLDFSRLLDSQVPDFQGTNIAITVVKAGVSGNGLADIASIDAYDSGAANRIDLGKVSVQGNLQYIDAGDTDLTTKAIKSLVATSMGETIATDGATSSQLHGSVGSVLIKHNFNGYLLADPTSRIETLTVKGNVGTFLGGSNNGRIDVTEIGTLTIGGIVSGGSGNNSGNITAQTISSISTGSVYQGSGTNSGEIFITGIPQLV